jgi:hypothetical protein
LPATVLSTRRSGARYRIEAVLEAGGQRIEVETDEPARFAHGTLIHVEPLRWHVYPV